MPNIKKGVPLSMFRFSLREGVVEIDANMTLRDYFASTALVMFTDAQALVALREEARASGLEVTTAIARAAYELADALLAEREK